MKLDVFVLNISSNLNDRYNKIFSDELAKKLSEIGHDVNMENRPAVYIDEEDLPLKYMTTLGDIDSSFSSYENSDGYIYSDDLIIVKNRESNKYVVLDFQDGNRTLRHVIDDENCVGFIESFYDQHAFDNTYDKSHLIVPGTFFPMHPHLVEQHYDRISKIEPTDKRMFFAGTVGYENGYKKADGKPRREIVMVLKDKYPDCVRILDRNEKLPRVEWWEEAAKHYVNLALPGHPWCNREHELWGLGLPILASEWVNPTINRPIPNYHYLAADGGRKREHTGVCIDVEYAADKLYERYKKSIDNPDYLKWIGSNGRKYYEDYIKPSSSAKYYAEMIDGWQMLK